VSIEENKAIVRSFYESFSKEDSVRRIREAENRAAEAEKILRAIFTEAYAPDCIMHATEGDRSLEEDIQYTLIFLTAFPDLRVTVEDMVAEDDKVATHWTMHGTHDGPLSGIPATGKQVTVKGVTTKRITDGKVVEEWALIDMLGMMQQLSTAPSQ
jgi:steroid delta-isomerase-like uncharacterized protein